MRYVLMSMILVLIFAVGIWATCDLMNWHLPRIRRVKFMKKSKAEIEESEKTQARWARMKARQLEQVRAEKRLEERHEARQADLLEFDYRMEALLPHAQHTLKTRLSPRTGCYECEMVRKADQDRFSLWMSGI